jgi:Neuraminidase (sialidase)
VLSASKSHALDGYAATLLEHHGKIQLKESRSLAPQYKSNSNYLEKKGQSKGSHKPWYGSNRTAYWADANGKTWHEPEEYFEEDEHVEHGHIAQ